MLQHKNIFIFSTHSNDNTRIKVERLHTKQENRQIIIYAVISEHQSQEMTLNFKHFLKFMISLHESF